MAKEEAKSGKSGLNQQKVSKYKKIIWVLALTPVLILLLVFTLTSINVFGDLPNVEELQNPKSNLATVVYSSDAKILGKYYLENRTNVKYSDLSPFMVNALIATEDARFHEHSGVDMKALFRSISGLVSGSASSGGGSTLTQQLAKMQFPREKMSKFEFIFRKLKEWVIALKLEKLYTKEEIMTMYLNKFDFLNQAVGVRSAAQIYFNTTPDKLKLEEAAMLVGMAKNPSLFNPVNPKRAEATMQRRNVVMNQMVKYGYLTKEKYDSLKVIPLNLHFMPEDHNEGLAPYFREYLRTTFLDEWCKSHVNPETNKPYNVYKDGLKIYTTIDSRMQKYAEEAVDEHMHSLQDMFIKDCKKKKNAPFAWNVNKKEIDNIMNSAMKRSERWRSMKKGGISEDEIKKSFQVPIKMTVYSNHGDIDTVLTPSDSIRYYKSFLQTGFMAMEPETGYIKAWVGGINHKHFKYDHVNKNAKRQVGSTFKPFVYALAIQEGSSPCELIPNVRTCIPTGEGQPDWCPDNSDGSKGTGVNITLRMALANSVNYVTAALMKRYGPQAVVDLVKRLGVTTKIEPVPSICLGTADISVLEMVGANSTFANRGRWIEPIFVTRIEDRNGKVLEEFVPKSEEVFSEEKAYVMTQLMQGVVQGGTGSRIRSRYKLTNPIAGKTGTTQNNADGWFMGLTPDLVGGCWVGGEDRSVHFNSTAEGQGASMALPIWGKFFQKVYADKTIKISKGDFFRPARMTEVELDCSKYDQETQNIFEEEDSQDPFDL
ncbi:MAG: transglycosylase domain-containing protein [Bacteroidota bacterium]|nr:transglycosylase domain-containing protein [Bacteroidota bacterium]